ncbi:MAG: metal-dependent transcriptional regulator [Lachnospiraceae bacterium]|nr:metal-dependent transcriptional regulator [Lachnospiraceae bacterium]
MEIHESAEDYLEKILMLKQQNGTVRSIDIATLMGYSKPSISIAMKHLREDGYIVMDKDNLISLTDKGSRIAERIYFRHRTLRDFLVMLGVSEHIADRDACKMEHDMSDESFEKLRDYLEKVMAAEGGYSDSQSNQTA